MDAPKSLELVPEHTALLVVDFQQRLSAAMPKKVVARNAHNLTHLLTLARRLDIPVIATEQYPQGLGPMVDEVRAHLIEAPLPKTTFSVMRDPQCAAAVRALDRNSIVVTGMETHVCIYQTVRDLSAAGYAVHVPVDAVVSRFESNWRVGLELVSRAGGIVTSTEVVLFDLLNEGKGEVFKEISRRIR